MRRVARSIVPQIISIRNRVKRRRSRTIDMGMLSRVGRRGKKV